MPTIRPDTTSTLGRWYTPCLLYVSSNANILPPAARSAGEPARGKGFVRARRSNGALSRRREATFKLSSVGADFAAAAFFEAFAMQAGRGRNWESLMRPPYVRYVLPICAIRDRPLRVSLISSSALGLTANND